MKYCDEVLCPGKGSSAGTVIHIIQITGERGSNLYVFVFIENWLVAIIEV